VQSRFADNRRGNLQAFAWGALGAALFGLIVELNVAQGLIRALGERDGLLITVGFGAPCVEEFFKGLALLIPVWFFRGEVDSAARSQRDEWGQAPILMQQARVLKSLNDPPLIVVTAARNAQDGWLPLQNELANLSSNSEHRVLANTEHASLTTNEGDARASTQAIVDVVMAVRTGQSLTRH